MAKKQSETEAESKAPFENTQSDLDEMTHNELLMMHGEPAAAVLFAKNIQWRTVGSCLLVFGAFIVISIITNADTQFEKILTATTIGLTCGSIFVLTMYQSWQFNEFTKMDEVEKQLSTLYGKIRNTQSRRFSSYQRYTLLICMIFIIVIGALIAILGIPKS
jgi:hypothetical protein